MIVRKYKYTLDEVLKDILEFEGLLPYLDYNDFKNQSYKFLYSEVFYNKLNSKEGYVEFYKRNNFYFHKSNKSIYYIPILLRKYIINLKRSERIKKYMSYFSKKPVPLKKDNWTV